MSNQKLPSVSEIRVLFHGEGDVLRGTGHLVRSIGMASDLRMECPGDWQIAVVNSNDALDSHVRSEWIGLGLRVPERIPLPPKPVADWREHADTAVRELEEIPRAGKVEILLTDGKFPWSFSDWQRLKDRFEVVVAVDNFSCRGSVADAALFPIDYLPSDLSRMEGPTLLTGADWVWLHPGLDRIDVPVAKAYDYSVLMGGADPNGLTLQAVDDILFRGDAGRVLILTGPAFRHSEMLHEKISGAAQVQWTIRSTSAGFHEQLVDSRLTLCAFGLTAIEMEYLGQACVLYHHHEMSLRDVEMYLGAHSRNAVKREDWIEGNAPFVATGRRMRPRIGASLQKFIEGRIRQAPAALT